MNPALRVPTLVLDDGRTLGESNAITWYFADGTEYLPDDRFERAQVLQWLFFEQYDHEPNIAVARFWQIHGIDPGPDQLAAKRAGGEQALTAIERHLADGHAVPGRGPLHDRRHRAVRVHARRGRGRLRSEQLRRDRAVARACRRPAGLRADHSLT